MTFCPQTDGQAEKTIHTLKDMSRAPTIDFQKGSDDNFPLIEFTYNIYHSSICMAFFEDLYGRSSKYPIGWFEVNKVSLIGPEY